MKGWCLIVFLAASTFGSPSHFTKTLRNKLLSSPVGITPYIISADNATEKSAPYLVSLSISEIAYAHYCSGVIIAKEWCIVPAHCIDELTQLNGKPEGILIYAGLTDRSNINEAQVRKIDFAFKHKGFNGVIGSDDIALVHVTPSFNFNSGVKEITLPFQNEVFDGKTATVYGWGLKDPLGTSYSNKLQMAKSSVLTQEKCRTLLPKDTTFTEKHVCVNITACYGDGGAPLVTESAGGVVEFIGFVSYGFVPCGYSNRPTVFTSVSPYRSWIAEVQWAYYVLH